MCLLFQQLQHLIWQRRNCFYIQHMKVHTALPGPLNEGNNIIDQWTKMEYIYIFMSSTLEKAKAFHKAFHVNAKAL